MTRKISNSEVGTWLTCRQKYYWKFDRNLTPNKAPDALSRGILFHLAMEHFNKQYIQSQKFFSARLAGEEVITYQLSRGIEYNLDIVIDTKRIYDNYMGILEHRINEWEILEAEQSYDLPINDQYSMPIKIDLLVREKATGEIALVDYKTCYDFWSDDQIALSAQAPKYIGVLRNSGQKVDKLILEQIRYRKIKEPTGDQLFRRTSIVPSNAKLRNVLSDHIVASNSIVQYRMLHETQRKQLASRTLNPMVCKGCEVRELCKTELDGGNVDYLIQVDFRTNDYGYNQIQPDVLEVL